MTSRRTSGRVVGAMTLLQLAVGLVVNIILVSPLFRPPGIVANAAGQQGRIALAVVLAIGAGLLALGVAVQVHLAVPRQAQGASLWVLMLAGVTLAMTAVEQIHLASLFSLSMGLAKAGASGNGASSLSLMVSSSRNWSHYVGLILTGCMFVSLYAALLRGALLPRALAWFGIVAALLFALAVALPLFGRSTPIPMLVPIALSQFALALWLVVRGFPAPPTTTPNRRVA